MKEYNSRTAKIHSLTTPTLSFPHSTKNPWTFWCVESTSLVSAFFFLCLYSTPPSISRWHLRRFRGEGGEEGGWMLPCRLFSFVRVCLCVISLLFSFYLLLSYPLLLLGRIDGMWVSTFACSSLTGRRHTMFCSLCSLFFLPAW